jgi:histone arginine demethylase JMJD6
MTTDTRLRYLFVDCNLSIMSLLSQVRMRYFIEYLRRNQDDSPLYVFDSHFDEDACSKSLLVDYKVPSYFPEDLFHLVGEKRRPPYRWFLVGPCRSGTKLCIRMLCLTVFQELVYT